MSAEKAQKLVQGGIKAVRDGKPDLARKAFTQALKLDPNNEGAWLGMATITDDTKDKLRILKKILDINPNSERAKEAIRRLAADQKKTAEPPPPPKVTTGMLFDPDAEPDESATSIFSDVDESASSVFSDAAPILGDDDLSMPPMPGDDDLGLPPMPGDDDLGLPPMPGDDDLGLPPMPGELPPVSSPVSSSGGGLRSLKSLRDTSSQELPAIEEEQETPRIMTSAEAFAKAPQPPAQGESGTPFVDEARLDEISGETLADVQTFLEDALADYLTPEFQWAKKKRGRAGASEYPIFIGQVVIALTIFLIVVGAGLYSYIQSNPAAQLIIYGASPTASNTPTVTPTSTPGFTNTPSPTPSEQASLTPALNPIVTPGNPDQFFPPRPTAIFYPNPLRGSSFLTDAVELMDLGRMDEALEILEEELDATELSGDYPPVYHLAEWHVRQGDYDEARDVIGVWEDEWEDSGSPVWENAQPLYLVSLAMVDVAEAQALQQDGFFPESEGLLVNAERRLNEVLGIGDNNFVMDTMNPMSHYLLAQRFILIGEDETTLEILENAIAEPNNELYSNTLLRMEKAKVLVELERYDEALQEAAYILYLNPFLEDALILQADTALKNGKAGLGVLYSQQYLLYYPGSVQGYWLLGQAREAENKFDLAISAYSRGLNGDWDDEEYTSDPYLIKILLRRANLYTMQGELELASEDFALASEFSDDTPATRIIRLEAAFASGDYATVIADAEDLLGESGVARDEILLMLGRAYVEQGRDYNSGLEILNQALATGLLSSSEEALAQEYIARASNEIGNRDEALEAIQIALEAEETGTRRYVRGLIYEGLGERELALLDYEYVLTWGQIYPYDFLDDAQTRYNRVSQGLR